MLLVERPSAPAPMLSINNIIFVKRQSQWPDGYQLASKMHFKFPQFNHSSLNQLMINASPEAIKLVNLLLQWNPARRPSAQQALK